MIGVVAILRVRDGQNDDFETIFAELTAKVRANEPGNVLYQLTRSRTDANTYKVLELYKNQESLTAHGGTDYFRELGRKLGPCMAGRPDVEYLDAIG